MAHRREWNTLDVSRAARWTHVRAPDPVAAGATTPAMGALIRNGRTFPNSLKGPSLKERHVIAGAGPAGLTVAWQLARRGEPSVVLESDPEYVGGLARTVRYKGHRFDIGGHRFYSKSAEINDLWKEMLPTEFIQVSRLSRIYYNRAFFPYPISVGSTLAGLGLVRSVRMALSYLKARLFPRRPEVSFEDWVINRFGFELYNMFFKTYTEKVWGMPCAKMSKTFAAQRIRSLSFSSAVKNALFPAKKGKELKTLINAFIYPRYGPGQLWESVRAQVEAKGARVLLGKKIVRVRHQNGVISSFETVAGETFDGDHFYSTMPLRDLILALEPAAPPEVLASARALRYRDFLIVALIVKKPDLFPDNWIYVHDPAVQVGRIQNYKNWSAAMIGEPGMTCLGLEYFCNEDEPLWNLPDAELVTLAAREVGSIGLAKTSECLDGAVVRMRRAYPVYDGEYEGHRERLKVYLAGFGNLQCAGRGALHSYNNQDHSMMAAIYCVRNALEGAGLDPWMINTEEEYAEEGMVKKTG
jgi:protoporphyrinogen oxidase